MGLGRTRGVLKPIHYQFLFREKMVHKLVGRSPDFQLLFRPSLPKKVAAESEKHVLVTVARQSRVCTLFPFHP